MKVKIDKNRTKFEISENGKVLFEGLYLYMVAKLIDLGVSLKEIGFAAEEFDKNKFTEINFGINGSYIYGE